MRTITLKTVHFAVTAVCFLSASMPVMAQSQQQQATFPATPPNLVVNGSFEDGKEPGELITVKTGQAVIPGWSVSRNSVDYIGTYLKSAHGNRHIDIDGTPGPGGIVQTLKTLPGHQYRLSFEMAGNNMCAPQNKRIGVEVAGNTHTFSQTGGVYWMPYSLEFIAPGNETRMEFFSMDSPNSDCGALLDTISVVDVTSLIPQRFAGEWKTPWGVLKITMKGRQAYGSYPHDGGRIEGVVSEDGQRFIGSWREAPSYLAPKDGGRLMLQMSPDGRNFDGKWGYGEALNQDNWDGTRLK